MAARRTRAKVTTGAGIQEIHDAGTPESAKDNHGLAAFRQKLARGGRAIEGKESRPRLDRGGYAAGGKVKGKGKMTVNVIVAGGGPGAAGGGAMPPMMPAKHGPGIRKANSPTPAHPGRRPQKTSRPRAARSAVPLRRQAITSLVAGRAGPPDRQLCQRGRQAPQTRQPHLREAGKAEVISSRPIATSRGARLHIGRSAA